MVGGWVGGWVRGWVGVQICGLNPNARQDGCPRKLVFITMILIQTQDGALYYLRWDNSTRTQNLLEHTL